MPEPPQVPGLGKYCQGVDWPDAGDLLKSDKIRMLTRQFNRLPFNLVPLPDQGQTFLQHHAEHGNGFGIKGNWQADAFTGSVVYIGQQAFLRYLPANNIPGPACEFCLAVTGDTGRSWKLFQEIQKPATPAAVLVALGFWEIEGQIVGLDPMPQFGLGL